MATPLLLPPGMYFSDYRFFSEHTHGRDESHPNELLRHWYLRASDKDALSATRCLVATICTYLQQVTISVHACIVVIVNSQLYLRMGVYMCQCLCGVGVTCRYCWAYSETKQGVQKGDRVWQLSFGSGFKCCSAVWTALKSNTTQHDAWTDTPSFD